MTIDDQDKIYKAGYIEGQKHMKPSELTTKLINNMEDKFDNLKDKVYDIEKNVLVGLADTKAEIIKEFGNSIDVVKEDCDSKIKDIEDKSDKKYANKRIEKNYDKLIWLIITTIVLSGLGLIYK